MQTATQPNGILCFQLVDEPNVSYGVLNQDLSDKPAATVIRARLSVSV